MSHGKGYIEYFYPEFIEGSIDETYQEEISDAEADKSNEKASIYLREHLQSGPRVIRILSLSYTTFIFPYFLWLG